MVENSNVCEAVEDDGASITTKRYEGAFHVAVTVGLEGNSSKRLVPESQQPASLSQQYDVSRFVTLEHEAMSAPPPGSTSFCPIKSADFVLVALDDGVATHLGNSVRSLHHRSSCRCMNPVLSFHLYLGTCCLKGKLCRLVHHSAHPRSTCLSWHPGCKESRPLRHRLGSNTER